MAVYVKDKKRWDHLCPAGTDIQPGGINDRKSNATEGTKKMTETKKLIIQKLFENWGLKGIKVSTGFLSMEWEPQPDEQQAVWELYVELLTRGATQPLAAGEGDEEAALESVYRLFAITRELLKAKGRRAQTFSRIAIIVLNQKIRPFTTIWHGVCARGELDYEETRTDLRYDLENLQSILRNYAGMLAEIAGVEDFQELDEEPLTEL